MIDCSGSYGNGGCSGGRPVYAMRYIIANGIIAAAKSISLSVPLVVRLEGTNVDLGKQILRESGLALIAADDLADAAKKVVQAAKGV